MHTTFDGFVDPGINGLAQVCAAHQDVHDFIPHGLNPIDDGTYLMHAVRIYNKDGWLDRWFFFVLACLPQSQL